MPSLKTSLEAMRNIGIMAHIDAGKTTTTERIRQARKSLKMLQADFARAISVSNSYVGELERGYRRANDRILHLISLTFGISEEWLRDGTGDMFYKSPEDKRKRLESLFNELPPAYQDYVVLQIEQLLRLTREEGGAAQP